jgi:hypothetical protein
VLKVITYGITQPAHLPYYKAADPIMPESGDKDSASENKNKIFRAVFEQDRKKKPIHQWQIDFSSFYLFRSPTRRKFYFQPHGR